MDDKKTTIRFSEREIHNIENLKDFLHTYSINGVIKNVINNFLVISKELQEKKKELITLKNENVLLKNKIETFNNALKNLKF